MKRVMVVGIGNPLLKDEGAGVHAVKRLLEKGMPEGVEIVDGGTNTYDLVDLFCSADDIIIIDALKGGLEPGTIYRAPLEELGLKTQEGAVSLHDLNFMEAMSMVKLLGKNPRVTVFGIEPEIIDWGLDLSEKIEKKMPRLLELVNEEVCRLLEEN